MDTDLSILLRVQPTLNPWLVLLLGSITGLLAFAVSNALHVRNSRSRRSSSDPRGPLATRIRQGAAAAATIFLLLMLIRAVPGPTLVNTRGWLSGNDLFTVTGRPGFMASYPNAEREVNKGDVILQLVRDAGPDEVAAAASRRALLIQDLEFARLETLRIDPLLLAEHGAAKEQLKALEGRQQKLLDAQESLLRGAPRQQLTDQSRLHDIEREIQSARHELDQTATSLKAASTSLDIANRPGSIGLIPADDVAKRAERVEVLDSRRAELRERVALLTRERQRLQVLTAASEATNEEQMRQRDAELKALQEGMARARERVQTAWQAIGQDKVRAERQHQHRVRQIELQVAELDELLDAREGALEVRAPWSGVVGFRESSPASARSGNRPLLVLYRPGTIAAKVRVPTGQASPDPGDTVEIDVRALVTEAAGSTFAGTIAGASRQADGSAELLIAGDPPAIAVRDLAQGNSVPVHVHIRQPNPLAAVSAPWWSAAAVVLGFVVMETRRFWARRRAHRRAARESETGRNRWLGLDWGGDPEEFLEYVVGVGILPRRVRRGTVSANLAEERRRPRTPLPQEASAGALESA